MAVTALDQITKLAVLNGMDLWASKPVIPGFFNLVHIVNKGSAFGFLNRGDINWQTPVLIVASIAAMFLVFYLLSKARPGDVMVYTGLGLILGGDVGNLIDRVAYGHVIDFLDFHVGGWHWPAFNVADIGISMGALIMIVSFYQAGRNASRID